MQAKIKPKGPTIEGTEQNDVSCTRKLRNMFQTQNFFISEG